jgi:hypothetical protein
VSAIRAVSQLTRPASLAARSVDIYQACDRFNFSTAQKTEKLMSDFGFCGNKVSDARRQ